MMDTFRQFSFALIVIIFIQSHQAYSAAVQDSSTSNPLPTQQVDSQNSRMIYWSHQGFRSRPDSSAPVKLCGYRLLDAVRVLCRGSFNSFSRRSDAPAPLTPTNNNNNFIPKSGSQNINSVTLNENSSPQNQQNSHTSHHRARRHIIEECCRRGCNRRQMLKYCDWNV